MAYAGLDVGTSGCKMVVYDSNGTIISSFSRTYKQTGKDGYRELDPEVVIHNAFEVIREAADNSPQKIETIAVASMGESIICVDKDGNSLINSMLTGDKRGIAECERLEKIISSEDVHRITGLPLSELYALPKWVWIRQNTDVFDHTKYIFFYEDYVGWKLTSKRKVSYSSAARSMAFDIKSYTWSDNLLSLAGLNSNYFSDPVPSGTIIGSILPEISRQLHLPAETIVVAGGHDQSCCALGSGMINSDIGEDGQGTCEVMEFVLPEALSTPHMVKAGIACAPHVIPGMYLAQIELPNCGILMNWAKDVIFSDISRMCTENNKSFFSYMDSKVMNNPPGSIYVFPSFGSAGNPDVCNDSKGTLWGLTVQTTPEEIFQGIKEGMSYQIYMAFLEAKNLGIHPSRIRVTGGGANSDLTLQMRADVFDITMETMENTQAGTLACAMLSMKALHPELSYAEISERVIHNVKSYTPRPALHEQYMNHYLTYTSMYHDLLKYSNSPLSTVRHQ